ncbi:AAA family ATPase [Azospirillum formosense]|uniref:AAA family ATPase n=1 Tax=Azospirillum formosense TaxID=861533 RepID=A0ABX2KYK5_9PROT|nr:TniB family NTP-binding protein [Azospirillum formosense]MBY3753870.1 AAA family ATPase [Azospirillum formosense]NUB18628.1 AAA family ATPase [Azospirillum formosense]
MGEQDEVSVGAGGQPAGVMANLADPILNFESLVVPHPNHVQAKAAIGRLHARYKPPGGKRLKARALLVIGATGSGKTTALEDYMRDYPDLTLESVCSGNTPGAMDAAKVKALRDGDIRRIVYVEAAKKTTQRALVAALLGAFGYKAREHWNTSDIIEKIEFYADEMGTSMIFIDEGHHFVHEKDDDATEDVSEFIKSLLNRTNRQIVITGLPELLKITRYGQLCRRLQPAMVLRPYNWTTKQGRIAFCSILGTVERMLDLPEPSGLAGHDVARRWYVATGGEIGIVWKYASEALSLAKEHNLPSLSLELMADVHSSWNRTYDQDEVLDFDTILDEAEEATKAAEATRDSNPFLCDEARLKELWAESRVAADRLSGVTVMNSGKGGSRKTKLKAKGRQPFTPFTRS